MQIAYSLNVTDKNGVFTENAMQIQNEIDSVRSIQEGRGDEILVTKDLAVGET